MIFIGTGFLDTFKFLCPKLLTNTPPHSPLYLISFVCWTHSLFGYFPIFAFQLKPSVCTGPLKFLRPIIFNKSLPFIPIFAFEAHFPFSSYPVSASQLRSKDPVPGSIEQFSPHAFPTS